MALFTMGGGPKPEQSKTVTPTAAGFTVTPDAGKVLSSVVVNGDADLVAANIAEGISLFGISGTHGAFLAGTNIIAASDNAVSNNIGYGVYTKKKEAQIKKAGTYRISFQLATGNEAYFAKARIYKNGTAVGTLRTTYSTTWVEYTEDITFTLNDYCQLYLCSEYDGTDSLTRFFRIGISLIYAIPIITM